MLISSVSCESLRDRIISERKIFCRGLFLSARWFVFSQVADSGFHLIVMPSQEAAEYCCADLYNLIEGDRVFYLPTSGKNVERSNYKSTLGVQRTAALSEILKYKGKDFRIVVSYPEALSEPIPLSSNIEKSIFNIKVGDEYSHERIIEILSGNGFYKVDFVSAPGQYAIRGSIVDIFSYSYNFPYRTYRYQVRRR